MTPGDACEAHFQSLAGTRSTVGKIEAVTLAKWPEVLAEDATPFDWARAEAPELAKRYQSLQKEANELWLNGRVDEFKKMATEWAQTTLLIFKQYAAYLKQGRAA